MADFIICFILQIAKAERAGIQTVFIRRCRRGDHRTVQLSVASNRHIKATVAREQPGLLLHRIIGALHFVLAGADVAGTGHTAEGEAAACRHAGLLRFEIVAVLLAAHPQIAANIRNDFIAVNLRAVQNGVASADHRHRAAAVQRGFSPGSAVAFFIAFCRVNVGENTDPGPAAATANTHSHTTAAAAIFPGGFLRIGCARQQNVIFCIQRRVTTRFQLAACDHHIAAVFAFTFARRGDRQVTTRIQRATRRHIAFSMILRF
ncbi:hypothetical protein D3C78_1093400 [compost metagenome]